MSVFNWLKTQLDNAETELKKFKNKELMQAIVAACAVVAYADGNASSAEKQKMLGFIKQSEALKVFNTDEVIASFSNYVSKFEFDQNIGFGEAMSAVTKLANKPEQAQLLIRVCIAIASSDGHFDREETSAVIQMCKALNLNPESFGLAS
jgi:tellurite resistance protein TerB